VVRALITGITGQDGSYLADRLVGEGAEVHGMVLDADPATPDLRTRLPQVILHEGDLADQDRLRRLVHEVAPDELYNLAGVSSVAYSWAHPILTAELTGVAAAVLLQSALEVQIATGRRVACVQASSSEMFGNADTSPQDESTPVRPVSPYGAAKAYAHHMVGVLRGRGLHVSSCILFNHESPRRPEPFVTRKITAAAVRIARDGSGAIRLGNLDARRDWGWAPDYVDAMVRAARHDEADDFVVATGVSHTVAEFAELALRAAGVGGRWRDHVEVDPSLLRPLDTTTMVGDATKARTILGWRPTVELPEIIRRMVEHDAEVAGRG
jgi:GDPmannose 4,6-dehydratase